MAKYYNTIKVKKRIPNFVEHKPEDLTETTVSNIDEINDIDWVKKWLDEPGSRIKLDKIVDKDEYDCTHLLLSIPPGEDKGWWIGWVWMDG